MSIYDNNRYMAEVVRWVDGDTVKLIVQLGQYVSVTGTYRLARIDAPEVALRKGVTPEEKEKGLALKKMLSEKYPPGTEVEIATSKAGKFGRWLAEIWVLDHEAKERYCLNTWLLEKGLADSYN